MKNQMHIFNRAIQWVRKNSIDNKGITVTSKQKIIYPEVTGYYIPTLLEWGERQLAVSYAKYLCDIQKENGSWYDAHDKKPYVFDSAQILKGLLSIREILPEVDKFIIKGCDWLISNVNEEGRLVTPDQEAWGNDEEFCSDLIHIYCLAPLIEASKAYEKPIYGEMAEKVLEYYKENYKDRILNFRLLSHFYAYVMEGLVDVGEIELVREAMAKIEKVQNYRGGIPGLYNVKWVCSTGLFQLALVWYKLGELDKGNRIFRYACSLQNETGGWYGSYPGTFLNKYSRGRQKAYYFPEEEISWANKYFLDALSFKTKLEFELQASTFSDVISEDDGRYMLIEKELLECEKSGQKLSVCDIGCGKGRYLKILIKKFYHHKYYAMDLSEKVMEGLDSIVEKRQGRLTNIPYNEGVFDYIYVCEALEHAVNIEGALKELWRVTKPGGKILIIDKPAEQMGKLEIDEWEQWIDDKVIKEFVDCFSGVLTVVNSVSYECKNDGLFRGWIIKKL